jgi:hypothetical protein
MQADRLREKASESGIVAALSASPMYRERPATAFDAGTLLDAELLAEFIQATQSKEWAKLAKQFPGAESATLAAQVSALIVRIGTGSLLLTRLLIVLRVDLSVPRPTY